MLKWDIQLLFRYDKEKKALESVVPCVCIKFGETEVEN